MSKRKKVAAEDLKLKAAAIIEKENTGGGKVEVVTIDDQAGRDHFDKLTHEQKDHLRRFALSRPGWDLAFHTTVVFDEKFGVPGKDNLHRYEPIHQYQAGTLYTVGRIRHLPRPGGMQILDIGSPVEQNIAVAALDGVVLSVVDIRPQHYPAILPFQTTIGNATKLPVHDECADVVTSNCALCHVGDGRYGDALDADGDINMLREVKRVLKQGKIAYIGVGPLHHGRANMLFNIHRVYNPEWIEKMAKWAGLKLSDFLAYDTFTGQWCTPDLMEGKVRGRYYGFCTLEKPVW